MKPYFSQAGMKFSEAAVTGRLAPSPTGRLHLGNAFAFLAAWLGVRSRGGRLILRMEDIDPERSRPEYAAEIVKDLRWLGLDWDEGPDMGGPGAPYVQSACLDDYARFLDSLAQRGLCYPCFCSRKDLRSLASAPHIGDEGAPYPGLCRRLGEADLLRLKSAGRRASLRLDTQKAMLELAKTGKGNARAIAFTDRVLGPQLMDFERCGGDFALRRSDGVPAYQLAVAFDDARMGVTEVVRGDDLLLSTPRQILLFGLMGRKTPVYAHVPLLHDARGERLAKRHKALELGALRMAGVRPEAIVGWLAEEAGWRAQATAAHPAELLTNFSFESLRGRHLRLPDNIIDILLAF